MFVDSADAWIPDEDYKACTKEFEIEELFGGKAYMGYDLSRSRDLTSISVVIEHPKTGTLHEVTDFFFPTAVEKNVDGVEMCTNERRIRAGSIDLLPWIEKGYIFEHKGKVISYDKVFERIEYYYENFNLQAIGYDQYNAAQLNNMVEENIDVELINFKQSPVYFNTPLKFLERAIMGREITLQKNPVQRWNFRNVVLYQDGNDNIKIVKNKSKDSVDGVVALGMAIGMYLECNYDAVANILDSLNNSE
jgi:phage terminase large subunit-like protein